jgi:peptidoglycan LD-endopeptidase CwlK
MGFKLSKRSLANLEGVRPELIEVVNFAIQVTRIDFGVTEGLRTVDRQRELVASGASQTMNSKHIKGHAVDLMAYIGTRASWELNLYDDIADAMYLTFVNGTAQCKMQWIIMLMQGVRRKDDLSLMAHTLN